MDVGHACFLLWTLLRSGHCRGPAVAGHTMQVVVEHVPARLPELNPTGSVFQILLRRVRSSEPVMFQVWRWNKITDFVPKLLDFEITVNLTVDFVPNG
jgi:hypothetical protein